MRVLTSGGDEHCSEHGGQPGHFRARGPVGALGYGTQSDTTAQAARQEAHRFVRTGEPRASYFSFLPSWYNTS